MASAPSFDPLKYVTPEDRTEPGQVWYSVEPAKAYPAVLAYIVKRIETGRRPLPTPVNDEFGDLVGTTPNALEPLYLRAKAVDVSVLLDPNDLPNNPTKAELAAREEALEIARLWFTEELQRVTDGILGLHILKDDAWKITIW